MFFRLENNVPNVYNEQSRDFQLFVRLQDLTNNGVRFDIKSVENLLDPFKCSDRILNLLCTRVGFFPKNEYNTYALRYVISSFSDILKNKGNKKGIEIALNAILKAEKNYNEYVISIGKDGFIGIYTKKQIINVDLLEDVLSYVLPVGYILSLGEYESTSILTSTLDTYFSDYYVGKVSDNYSSKVSKIINVDNQNNISTDPSDMHGAGSYPATVVVDLNSGV